MLLLFQIAFKIHAHLIVISRGKQNHANSLVVFSKEIHPIESVEWLQEQMKLGDNKEDMKMQFQLMIKKIGELTYWKTASLLLTVSYG
jgi:hypothetical protein